MISVLNYGSGNINAIVNLIYRANIPYELISKPEQVETAQRILVPGVGAFDKTMQLFDSAGLSDALRTRVGSGQASCLGICVGMQILADGSDEGCVNGLGIIPGRARKLDLSTLPLKPKTPHMGWNSVELERPSPLFEGVDLERGFYYLHSYYFECESPDNSLAKTQHGHSFSCAVENGRVFGVQFHPEKSHDNGVQLIKNFARL